MVADILEAVRKSILELEVGRVASLVKEALDSGISSLEILDTMVEAMKVIGEGFERKEYFLADLIMAAETFNMGLTVLKPLLKTYSQARHAASVVIGTVRGDIHDIGKNIVATMLTSAGFQVHDLGVDTPPEKFVEKIRETGASILAMSTLLTTSTGSLGEVIRLLVDTGTRDKVKVIVGGAAVTEELAKKVGADAYAEDAVKAVKLCRKLVEGQPPEAKAEAG